MSDLAFAIDQPCQLRRLISNRFAPIFLIWGRWICSLYRQVLATRMTTIMEHAPKPVKKSCNHRSGLGKPRNRHWT